MATRIYWLRQFSKPLVYLKSFHPQRIIFSVFATMLYALALAWTQSLNVNKRRRRETQNNRLKNWRAGLSLLVCANNCNHIFCSTAKLHQCPYWHATRKSAHDGANSSLIFARRHRKKMIVNWVPLFEELQQPRLYLDIEGAWPLPRKLKTTTSLLANHRYYYATR